VKALENYVKAIAVEFRTTPSRVMDLVSRGDEVGWGEITMTSEAVEATSGHEYQTYLSEGCLYNVDLAQFRPFDDVKAFKSGSFRYNIISGQIPPPGTTILTEKKKNERMPGDGGVWVFRK
jgi:hypothetical protein